MYSVNIVNELPNMALLPRQIFYDYAQQSAGFKFSMMIGRDFPSTIGFDIGIQNASGGICVVKIDGVVFQISDGVTSNISNTPFDEVEIVSTGATASSIWIKVSGMTIQRAQQLTKTTANDWNWGN